ncbi:MAG: tetratricopeptide repeat protein [Candidatus Korobacteraceae bacterium]
MNSRTCRWLFVSALLITASGAWAQRSVPPASDQKSVAAIEQQAAKGDATTQWVLGARYEHGKGVPQDSAKAAFWYRKAAEQGDADAQNDLGDLYDEGDGVPQDATEAAAWYRKAAAGYRKAAEQGDALAQKSLGRL